MWVLWGLVANIGIRIDWEVCPKCGSKAEIYYDPLKIWKTKVIWTR